MCDRLRIGTEQLAWTIARKPRMLSIHTEEVSRCGAINHQIQMFAWVSTQRNRRPVREFSELRCGVNEPGLRLRAAEAGSNQRQMFRRYHIEPPPCYALKYLSIRKRRGKHL